MEGETSGSPQRRGVLAACTALLAGMGLAGLLVRRWSADAVHTEIFPFPNGRDCLALRHDAFLGQVETLTVTRDAGSRRARTVFTQVGDTPLTFMGWLDGGTAMLASPGQDGSPSRWLLTCDDESCRLVAA